MQKTEEEKYITVKILREQYSKIEKLVEKEKEGFTGVSDFVRDAIRDKLEGFKK